MIDVIGALYDLPTAGEPVRLWGFHINITAACLEARPDLSPRAIHPPALRRVWAGDDPVAPSVTVALRFNGESAAREALGDLWPVDPA